MAQSKRKKKTLNPKLDRHPQCPSNSHTHIARSFMLKKEKENRVCSHQKLMY
jgi:hypothetical protein